MALFTDFEHRVFSGSDVGVRLSQRIQNGKFDGRDHELSLSAKYSIKSVTETAAQIWPNYYAGLAVKDATFSRALTATDSTGAKQDLMTLSKAIQYNGSLQNITTRAHDVMESVDVVASFFRGGNISPPSITGGQSFESSVAVAISLQGGNTLRVFAIPLFPLTEGATTYSPTGTSQNITVTKTTMVVAVNYNSSLPEQSSGVAAIYTKR
jgi:hypothetical protein